MRVVRPATLLVFGLLSVAALAVTSATPAAAQPAPTVRSEMAAHPRLARAIRQMEAMVRMLSEAPDDFGGNKAAAIEDMRRSIHSLRRALFYRLHMDDNALDRVNMNAR